MKLSIIITQYNETERLLFPLLSSIDNQLGVNFNEIEILILNDCSSTILSDSFLNSFVNINPIYIQLKENIGVGLSRNEGMVYAKGEYIMFCDADDMFYMAGSLGLFFNEIDTKHPDICTSSWLEEQKIDEKYVYVQHKIESTWIHGKIYRKQYLIDNEIRFHSKFRVHEDTYFNGLAFDLTNNKNYIDMVTYVWKYNPNSFTRVHNNSFSYKAFSVFIDAVIEFLKVIQTKRPDLMHYRVNQFILYVYFSFQLPHWQLEDSYQYRIDCENLFRPFIREYIYFYNTYPRSSFIELFNEERNKTLSNICLEYETFDSFLNKFILP